jgi:hypothetical protein
LICGPRFFDRGDRGRFNRFDHGVRFGRFDRDDRVFFRRNFFVGFDFAAFGFPGWWGWGYPYDYGYYPHGNAYYGDDVSYGDASTFDYKYWNNLAVSVQSELSRSWLPVVGCALQGRGCDSRRCHA